MDWLAELKRFYGFSEEELYHPIKSIPWLRLIAYDESMGKLKAREQITSVSIAHSGKPGALIRKLKQYAAFPKIKRSPAAIKANQEDLIRALGGRVKVKKKD